MPSFYLDPTQFLTPEELERATANLQAADELDAASAEAARQTGKNTAASGGPRTAEGKAISSRNAVKHGFAGSNPVIFIEDQAAFDLHLDSYFDRFQPVDQPERDTVRRAAIAMWRLDRLYALEAKLLNLEIDYHTVPTACILPPEADPFTRAAVAFKESAGDRAYDLCRRYLQAATREHDRAIRTFYLLESKRPRLSATTPAAAAAPPPQQPKATQNQQEPNELPQTRSRSAIQRLVNPYPSPRNTPKTAATPSEGRKKSPKAA